MKQLTIISIFITAFTFNLFAQTNIDKIVDSVEQNNTMLSALRKKTDADKIGNKTDTYLQNPEIEFAYLWGSPEVIGNRTNINIRQSFDFPTAYSYRNQISGMKNNQSDLEYQRHVKTVALKTRLICIDLIYNNALLSELSKRLNHAQSIADATSLKFESGETNILEFNKAQLNLLNIRKETESVTIERNVLQSELTSLNGGQALKFNDSVFEASTIASDFIQWYTAAEQNNPVLAWLKQENEIKQTQVKLNRTDALPKFQAGYLSETVIDQQFQGISVGLSIPLWENKNKVKYAKANVFAAESMAVDYKLQYYNQLKSLHTKAVALQENANDYRTSLSSFNSSELLKKALDKGEISLITYILELSIYYESINKLLETEKELSKSIAKLNQFM